MQRLIILTYVIIQYCLKAILPTNKKRLSYNKNNLLAKTSQ